jgi:hypothetical protein
LLGIIFDNNKNLRRILTDYGFQGHPLKKNYALTGYFDTNYNYNTNMIYAKKDALFQEFRSSITQNNVGALTQFQNSLNKNLWIYEEFNHIKISYVNEIFLNLTGFANQQVYYILIYDIIISKFYKKTNRGVC